MSDLRAPSANALTTPWNGFPFLSNTTLVIPALCAFSPNNSPSFAADSRLAFKLSCLMPFDKVVREQSVVDETSSIFKLCAFLTPNQGYDAINPNSPQHFKCLCQGYKIEELGEDFKDENYYCIRHKKIIIQKYKQDKKLKLKQEKYYV